MSGAAGDAAPSISTPLQKFKVIKFPDSDSDTKYPVPRSGHRTFVDNDFLYVIGGYTEYPIEDILREVWKYNLATRVWTKCIVPTNFPLTLASFACISRGDATFIVYGGTAIPFGLQLDETVYMGKVEGNEVKLESTIPRGNKMGCYGHVMVYDSARQRVFSVGGTDGTIFNLDVHALVRDPDNEENWKWEEYSSLPTPGLYRMEAILENNLIYLFGGGTTNRIATFETLQVFNVEKRFYETVETKKDPVHGFPTGRRCHSLVQWGRHVIIAGGCFETQRTVDADEYRIVLSCVWSFNLDSKEWKKMGDMPIPVYFHDASITNEGQMLIFGGVVRPKDRVYGRSRTSALQTLWLGPPTLFSAALDKMQDAVRLEDDDDTEFVLSDRTSIVRHMYSETVHPA